MIAICPIIRKKTSRNSMESEFITILFTPYDINITYGKLYLFLQNLGTKSRDPNLIALF